MGSPENQVGLIIFSVLRKNHWASEGGCWAVRFSARKRLQTRVFFPWCTIITVWSWGRGWVGESPPSVLTWFVWVCSQLLIPITQNISLSLPFFEQFSNFPSSYSDLGLCPQRK